MEQIEARGLAPRPYAYYLAKHSVFWTLASLSVFFGAISVAVMIYAGTDYFITGGRNFDDMPLDDVFQVLPWIWFATFAFFAASAYYTLRQTPRGYRFNALSLACATLALSIALGDLLHLAGAGQRTHEFLSGRFPSYERLTRVTDKNLANPDKGWLAGTAMSFDGKSTLTIKDFNDETWTVDVGGAKVTLDEPLGSKEDVSINGVRTGPKTFRAQSIKDWD